MLRVLGLAGVALAVRRLGLLLGVRRLAGVLWPACVPRLARLRCAVLLLAVLLLAVGRLGAVLALVRRRRAGVAGGRAWLTGLRLLRGWSRVLGARRLLLPSLVLLTGLVLWLLLRLRRLGVVRLVRRLRGTVLRTRVLRAWLLLPWLLLSLVRRSGATGGPRRRRGRRRCRCG
jgi:hypothetical protein